MMLFFVRHAPTAGWKMQTRGLEMNLLQPCWHPFGVHFLQVWGQASWLAQMFVESKSQSEIQCPNQKSLNACTRTCISQYLTMLGIIAAKFTSTKQMSVIVPTPIYHMVKFCVPTKKTLGPVLPGIYCVSFAIILNMWSEICCSNKFSTELTARGRG